MRKGKYGGRKTGHFTSEAAELLAINALGFLANEPEALSHFLALSGIGPSMLRNAAANPEFLAGVLDHFLSHEPLLIAFADHAGIPANRIAAARHALGGKNEAR